MDAIARIERVLGEALAGAAGRGRPAAAGGGDAACGVPGAAPGCARGCA